MRHLEVLEETGYTSDEEPIFLGEFLVNPATQTNQIGHFLITNAYKIAEQNLDENEEVDVVLIEKEDLETMIKDKMITQYFTVGAYYIAKSILKG